MNTRLRLILAGSVAIVALASCRSRDRVDGPYGDTVAEDMPLIAKAIGRPFKRVPKLELRTHDQVRAFLEKKFNDSATRKQVLGEEATYKVLGLIPDSLNLEKLMVSVLTEQVIGYYDPETKVLYVVQGAPEEYVHTTITHELVHALQDQYVNLDSLQQITDDDDRQSAVQAVIEGQAMYEQMVVAAGGPDNPAISLPGGWETMRQSIRDQLETQPLFSSAPMVIREVLLFSYINGAEFAQRYARTFPTGFALDKPPQSTRQVMHDSAYFGNPPDVPAVVTLPSVPGTLYQNDMGEFATRLYFFEHLENLNAAANAAAAWKGDRFVTFRAGNGVGIAWATVWNSAIGAASYASAMGETIKRRYGAEGQVAGSERRFSGHGRSVVISQREIGGQNVVLFVDVPAGTSTDVVDLSRVTVH